MVVGESKRAANIMDGIENTGDVRMHDHRLRLKQRFDIVRKLGQGTYGKVQLGINKKTGQEVAIKTIKKCKIESEADLIRIRREVQIMSSVRHPNIVHIYEVFENSEKMILVMEYCSGGELYDYLSQKKVLQEDEARRLFRQIATAVYYCHIHKICHRDLKLENVLLDDTGSAKIADFGLSNVFKETSLLSTFCGSPLYASPEIVKGTPYIGPEVDCWSLGVLLYTLVYGAMPFDGSNFKRLVRQISNGDYYEPRNPSSASPLIRDMLTVDPLKRADIAYICDHSWVNTGCETSCLEMSEALAAETPVRLDLLLSLAPAAPSNSNSVMVPAEAEAGGPEESCTDLTSSMSMPVEPSNSAEKRILDLVAEGGEDAIKPSPTRTIVTAGENKRKLELAMSASGLQRKKEKVASSGSLAQQISLPEEGAPDSPPADESNDAIQPNLKSSATITISPSPVPAPVELTKDLTKEIIKEQPKEDDRENTGARPRVGVKKKTSPTKEEKPVDKTEEPKQTEEAKPSAVAAAADKLTALSITQPSPDKTPKPKKFSIPGGNVGSFKDQFERRASLTTTPEVKRNFSKPAVSKIAKPKAQSEDRELPSKTPQDNGTVRLQQIGIEPSPTPPAEPESMPNRGGVKKTESEPNHGATPVDPSVLLQDARRSLQNSMAKLVEEKASQSDDSRRRAARDIISTAIRTGKPPVPYGRSSSAGVASLASPPGTPPAAPQPRLFRTEAHHRVEDHRNRGTSVERIIPIQVSEESPTSPPPALPQKPAPRAPVTAPPVRRLVSNDSMTSDTGSTPGEPIKKSAREFIIPIAVEGKGYVTPRQRSLEPEASAAAVPSRLRSKPRRISSLVSGGESEEEDDGHMHRLRPSRLARADSASSGEEDEEDEGFHLLTAENLFSTLLHRVRALTNRLNGEEGPGFPQHPHSLFNMQSPFFNSPHLPRRHLFTHRYMESKRSVSETREGWGSRDLHADFDSMFNKSRQSMPRGSSKKSGEHRKIRAEDGEREGSGLDLSDLDLGSIEFSEREMRALSGLTPALSRRLQRQLLAHLPPAAARDLRRTLSLHAPAPRAAPRAARSHSASKTPEPERAPPAARSASLDDPDTADPPDAAPLYSTLPRLRRRSTPREATPPPGADATPEPRPRRASADRPLLSKYLTPERHLSLDEPHPTEGAPAEAGGGVAPRRHSLRAMSDVPRRRVSRFLRSDFFDAPTDESIYARHKKEKELETQRILREIREKRMRADAGARSSTDEPRECTSPAAVVSPKDRSRSNTPFFPSLDNIKESALDAAGGPAAEPAPDDAGSRLVRPRSYPVKTLDSIDEPTENGEAEPCGARSPDARDRRESRLIRPKSYPASSPSPEKVYITRNVKQEETDPPPRDAVPAVEPKSDVEVSFSITLPRKKSEVPKLDVAKTKELQDQSEGRQESDKKSLTLKKYQIINNADAERSETDHKLKNGNAIANGVTDSEKGSEYVKTIVSNGTAKRDETKRANESESNEKKGTIKKKIIRKVSSKSKTDIASQDAGDAKTATEKKKVTKKVKEKTDEDTVKSTAVTKKKSMLQSIGHRLEKFASSKSNSPEKLADSSATNDSKKDVTKSKRTQREQSVPATVQPPTESNLIKRAVTLTDVAALEAQPPNNNKTTVSKVLGLFKKFEPKEKTKPIMEKSQSVDAADVRVNGDAEPDVDGLDRPRRPTSLLLNGLGRKNKYDRTSSDSVSNLTDADDRVTVKRENETNARNRNSLKLDFSRLPRVKKIVPTNPVIEPQIMNTSSVDCEFDKRAASEKSAVVLERSGEPRARSRSRSRSAACGAELRGDGAVPDKRFDENPVSPADNGTPHPLRNRESTSPDKEDVVDRIRRKSFYSRFNEKKQRRKSSLVGPGAVEYDPLARIHAPPADKYETSPTSPGAYDLSPGLSACSDVSPSTERYRALLGEPLAARAALRYDGYGLGDKIDTYRSLDRAELRKYPGGRSYSEYSEPLSYGAQRYSRTKSLLEGSEEGDEPPARDPLRYSRTLSMYSPGNYATYRPMRTHNPAIILKESEKEPSPENILEKIKQRKNFSISVTRKPDSAKDAPARSPVPSKGESDSTECSEKVD